MTTPNETRVSIKKLDASRQLAFGEVYIPYVPDSQGDFMTPEEIERVAHAFLKKGRVDCIDTEHNLVKNGSAVVESFVAREGDPDFTPGSWVLGVHIPDKDHWAKAERGEIGGFSMYGTGRRQQRLVEIEVPDDGVLFGKTAATPGNGAHEHMFALDFDTKGTFLGGETDEVNGHSHRIVKGTVTEPGPDGHRHRFSFVDTLVKGCSGMTKEQKKWKKIRENMKKGDLPGHPFRGNQYMSAAEAGGGGGGLQEEKWERNRGQANELYEESRANLEGPLLPHPSKTPPGGEAPKPVELTRSGHRPLSTIAREIRRDWGGKVNYAAKPYLDAMASLYDIKENYGMDTAESVVAYFLGNASTWRGPKAKEIKAELKKIIGVRKEDMTEEDLPESDGEQEQVRCKDCKTPKACGKAGRCLISYEDEENEEEEEEEE